MVLAPVAGLKVYELLTPLNSVWLKTLNASTRNLSRRFSLPMGIDLESDASKLIHPGPYMMLVPAFPMVPTAGKANAAGLKASLPLGSPRRSAGTCAASASQLHELLGDLLNLLLEFGRWSSGSQLLKGLLELLNLLLELLPLLLDVGRRGRLLRCGRRRGGLSEYVRRYL